MDRKGSAELLSCDTNRSKHASCDSLASDSKSSSLNSKLGQESVSILAVNCLYCVSFTYTHPLQPADCITIITVGTVFHSLTRCDKKNTVNV